MMGAEYLANGFGKVTTSVVLLRTNKNAGFRKGFLNQFQM
jgi:hypothetical protein